MEIETLEAGLCLCDFPMLVILSLLDLFFYVWNSNPSMV